MGSGRQKAGVKAEWANGGIKYEFRLNGQVRSLNQAFRRYGQVGDIQ